MKKKLLLLLLYLFLQSTFCIAQTPYWLWAKTGVSTGTDYVSSIAVDNATRDVYVLGNLWGYSITINTTYWTDVGGNDIFFVKYDANGNVIWEKFIGGTEGDYAYSLALDAYGNIYITGYFQSPILTFGTDTIRNSTGNYNIFLAKYNPSGNVVWVKNIPGTIGNAMATSVAEDLSIFKSPQDKAGSGLYGNTYLTGYFNSSTITFGATTLTNTDTINGSVNVFLSKYDAYGNVVWAKSAGGLGDNEAKSVAVDGSGNAFVTGTFDSPTLTFGSTTLTNDSTSRTDIFLAKYDANGNVLWARSAGGTTFDYANSVAVDALGNAYVAGYFSSSSITFGSITLINDSGAYYPYIFLVKYDVNGNVVWAKTADRTSWSEANSVTVDDSEYIYLAGAFANPNIIFGSTTLTSKGSSDIFLTKYDTSGHAIWAISAGGINGDEANFVTTDNSGNIYIGGDADSPTIKFGSTTLSNFGDDFFIAKLGYDTTITGINEELSNNLNTSLYPNPATDNLTIKIGDFRFENLELRIEDIVGNTVLEKTLFNNETNIDITSLAKGMYFIKVRTGNGVEVKKFIKE